MGWISRRCSTVATLGRNGLKRMHGESIRQYDDMSENYHWLYSDYVLCGALALKENDDVLRSAGPKARILDCSCGIGTLAIPLAKRGFEVSGSDASQGMVEQAIRASKNAGLDFPLSCCTWEELSNRFAGSYDLIFCLGNSIGHARGKEEMLRSLQGMRAVLKPAANSSLTRATGSRCEKRKHVLHPILSGESAPGSGVCPSMYGRSRRGSRTPTQ